MGRVYQSVKVCTTNYLEFPIVKKKETIAKSPVTRGDNEFLKQGRALEADVKSLRRRNLIALVESGRVRSWKFISDAMGYKDASRVSHLKQGYRPISGSLARALEKALDLPEGYLDRDGRQRTGDSVSTVDRAKAARRYVDREASAKELAAEYEVEEAVIYKWVAEYKRTSDRNSEVPGAPTSGRSIAELEAENNKLRDRLLKFMLAED